jgi:hypothetical protein
MSAMTNTRLFEPSVSVIDDAFPDAHQAMEVVRAAVQTLLPWQQGNVSYHYFPTRGGLTRSWNHGIMQASLWGHDVVCVTNSDVVFAPGWDEEIFEGLKLYDLVGPVTNAPGTEHKQYVGRYATEYTRDRVEEDLFVVQEELHKQRILATEHRFIRSALNGFCLVAKFETWRANAYNYDAGDIFRPLNMTNSKGQANPTPAMTLGEYELQGRWTKAGLETAICTGSYVLHYRAVSRGARYRMGDWVRAKPDDK